MKKLIYQGNWYIRKYQINRYFIKISRYIGQNFLIYRNVIHFDILMDGISRYIAIYRVFFDIFQYIGDISQYIAIYCAQKWLIYRTKRRYISHFWVQYIAIYHDISKFHAIYRDILRYIVIYRDILVYIGQICKISRYQLGPLIEDFALIFSSPFYPQNFEWTISGKRVKGTAWYIKTRLLAIKLWRKLHERVYVRV